MNKYWIILLVILMSCTPKKKTKEESNKVDTIEVTTIRSVPIMPIVSNFEGIWAENETADAFFIIRGDSIFNIDREGFHYHLNGDSIIINYEGFIGVHVIVKSSSDSLILINEDSSITKLYKR